MPLSKEMREKLEAALGPDSKARADSVIQGPILKAMHDVARKMTEEGKESTEVAKFLLDSVVQGIAEILLTSAKAGKEESAAEKIGEGVKQMIVTAGQAVTALRGLGALPTPKSDEATTDEPKDSEPASEGPDLDLLGLGSRPRRESVVDKSGLRFDAIVGDHEENMADAVRRAAANADPLNKGAMEVFATLWEQVHPTMRKWLGGAIARDDVTPEGVMTAVEAVFGNEVAHFCLDLGADGKELEAVKEAVGRILLTASEAVRFNLKEKQAKQAKRARRGE